MTRTAVLLATLLLLPLAHAAALPTWELLRTPNLGAEDLHILNGLACATSDDCWAVGYTSTCTEVSTGLPLPVNGFGVCNIHRTLILHWDGAEWTIVESPNSAVKTNQLYDVECLASDHCWAVGVRSDPPIGSQPFILRWDGASWQMVPSELPEGSLRAVSCVHADDCWTVGSAPDDLTNAGIAAMRWDGLVWSAEWSLLNVTKRLAPDPSFNELDAVSCLPSGECRAVGFVHHRESGARETLAVHWDGAGWIRVPTPGLANARNVLHSVACASATDCWAVGAAGSGTNVVPFLARWDGAIWALVSAPSLPSSSELEAVACVASDDCWAVGSGATVPLLHWDGASWTSVSAPRVGSAATRNAYHALECADASACFAAGAVGSRTLGMGTL